MRQKVCSAFDEGSSLPLCWALLWSLASTVACRTNVGFKFQEHHKMETASGALKNGNKQELGTSVEMLIAILIFGMKPGILQV
jgi:hypothetical protein